VLLPLLFAAPGQAATTLTQGPSQPIYTSYFGSVKVMAQTFTAPASARLDHVSLKAFTSYAPLTIEIRHVTSTGTPDSAGSALATTSSNSPLYCCSYHDFSFGAAGVALTKGVQYAIVITAQFPFFWWYTAFVPSPTTFTGGQAYVSGCIGCAWFSGARFPADFTFETWLGGAATQPPTVAVDNPNGVIVNEGTVPTVTGTYSVPSGAVSLKSEPAGVSPTTGSGTGTWTWTGAIDEPGQTVKITATDSQGLSSSVTFPVTVNAVKPSASIVAGAATKAAVTLSVLTYPEGTSITLNGAAKSLDRTDQAAGFTYAWNVTKDGSPYITGSGASFTLVNVEEGAYVVTLTATDDGGWVSDPTSMTVTAVDLKPTASIDSVLPTDLVLRSPLIIAPQHSLNFAGNYSDPGTGDTYTYLWTFGDDGTSTSLNTTHSYAAAGTYDVTLTVKDDDNLVGVASTKVTVQTTQQSLSAIIAYIQSLPGLNPGQKNSLIAKLNAASDAVGRGDTTAANNQLRAFLNELQADVKTNKVSQTAATILTADVHAIQGVLGTYNRFLEWWPLEA
jgi:PKD repeat protein